MSRPNPASSRSSALRTVRLQRCLRAVAGLLTVSLCSCVSSTVQSGLATTGNDPFQQMAAAQPEMPAPAAPAQAAGQPASSGSLLARPVQSGYAQPGHAQSGYGAPQVPQQAMYGAVQQVAWQQPAAPAKIPADTVQFSEASPREPLPGEPLNAPGCVALPCNLNPDEYLCDGGDRDYPVHYDSFYRHGLDTEDTIAEWLDEDGKNRVTPSNRVCVYSPRFGAMRTMTGSVSGYSIDRLASAADAATGAGLRSRLNPTSHVRNEPSVGVRVRSRVSGIDSEFGVMDFNQRVGLNAHTELVNVFQDLSFYRTGQMLRTEEARLSAGMQAAVSWSRDLYPVITASLNKAQQVEARFREQELVGVEDKSKPGKLRIVKLADRQTAAPGDVITFTIRYDNLGDREVAGINIVDNLTPRLEYVEDSGTSDRAGRLVVEENGEGSLVLTFEIEDPLPGNKGGVVTFQARVR